MPQGRRKVPFSGKAKKQQMQAKKQRQRTLLGMCIYYKNFNKVLLRSLFFLNFSLSESLLYIIYYFITFFT